MAHAPGGPPVEAPMTRACKAATERTKITPPPKKTRCGAGWCPAIADPKVVSSSHVESQRHGTFGTFAPCMCGHPSFGKFLKFCIVSLHVVVWVCSSSHSGKHWPACFDQTCGYPGEGPLTTLDSLGAPGMCLTPTQDICDKVRRKTKEKGGHELCGASEPPLPSPLLPPVSSAGNGMYGYATQHVEGVLRIYSVVVCQALLRMSAKAKAARRSSAAGQPKEHLD